jgi:hypothetical protein
VTAWRSFHSGLSAIRSLGRRASGGSREALDDKTAALAEAKAKAAVGGPILLRCEIPYLSGRSPLPVTLSSKNSKTNRIETGEGPAESGEICSVEVEEK